MLVYRITLAKYAQGLLASGRAARWNSNDWEMIYTSSSQSLACLENVVHRSQIGLSDQFRLLTIEIPERIAIVSLDLTQLPGQWYIFENMNITQHLGDQWLKQADNAVLRVPSSIIQSEFNYLLNPSHADFRLIKLLNVEPFKFDERIKR
ncbi:MAG: RES family NAD+ phosphorylase [Daejeonella sp.]|uniref:RES family NAD+ phosphorylase n=1 Tax=Daejeonella sp. TaxID=2805397 RepID=UPI00273752BC|nr:RES family NAD+ phosphorylase [Daejeonella sp.]MDP3469164.1 RES family NAD+ phosphorylase [Daejeonella sp.]